MSLIGRWRRHLPAEKIDGWLALIGGFSLHLTLGTLYCFGNLTSYMTSYLRVYVHDGIQYSDMIWIPTLATISQGLFMTFSGYLEDLIGVRFTVTCGCVIMTSGVLLTSITIKHSVILTIITYGCMFGLGTALAYAPPLAVAMKWYPKSKGLVNGIIVGGFGLGAFIFNQIQTAYLNPLNEGLDDGQFFKNEKILNRVPSVFLLLGSIYGVVQAMAVFLIRPPQPSDISAMVPLVTQAEQDDDEAAEALVSVDTDDIEIDDDSDEEDLELDRGGVYTNNNYSQRQALQSKSRSTNLRVSDPDMENLRPGQIVQTKEFWVLWLTFFMNTLPIGYINSMYKAYGQTFIRDDHFLATVGAFAAVFNASGRIFWGHLCDKFGYRTCMVFVTIAIAFLYITFSLAQNGGKLMFAAWVWSIFFCFCANFVLLPTATAQTFGTRYSVKNYGLVMTGQAAAAPVLALLTEFLSPVLGWLGMFLIIAGFSIMCGIMNLRFFPKNPSPRSILARLDRPGPSEL